ncbi:hypothetical protein BGX21_000094 [Mortierella sp. AD011]|nr:hypothetical protein BGX20_011475 [Mortierella sp. AD010]KAF9389456.1 hypothetical protein BGX21_000094 [Mortierella sp. AD011]
MPVETADRDFAPPQLGETNDLPFPNFIGEVYMRQDNGYAEHCYQYGSSSFRSRGIIQPKAIIYAKMGSDVVKANNDVIDSDKDVITAIKYAKASNIAVAVRTGGHQYCGASSTFGDNIQLDLSSTYTDFKWENDDCTLVTTGISYSLRVFNAKLGKMNRFVPHGQCSHVHLGGHVQTGGYGQLGRSFGLLADHIQRFRIITADGEPRWVSRGVDEDKDLFFAVLGGSPGNFGVLTHVTLKVYKDEDYPKSRGLRAVYRYDRDRLKRLLDVMVEMADDENFPADFDYCVTMLSAYREPFFSLNPDMDLEQHLHHPELYGKSDIRLWPPIIVVYAQWANLDGAGQTYEPTFFNKIKEAADEGVFSSWGIPVDDDVHTPMSKLTSDWIFQNVREFDLPFVKRAYMSNSKTLKDDGWTDWVADKIDIIQKGIFDGCKLSVQIQNFGGSNSRFYQNGLDGTTSYSWRDSNICCVLDCFHENDHISRYTAMGWQKDNDDEVGHEGARFCVEDRRVLWGSHDLNLHNNHQYYYDGDGKYDRLCEIKNRYDPNGVFTPNGFCVGAVPVHRRVSRAAKSIAANLQTRPAARVHVEVPIIAEVDSVFVGGEGSEVVEVSEVGVAPVSYVLIDEAVIPDLAPPIVEEIPEPKPEAREQAMFLYAVSQDSEMAAQLMMRETQLEEILMSREE